MTPVNIPVLVVPGRGFHRYEIMSPPICHASTCSGSKMCWFKWTRYR